MSPTKNTHTHKEREKSKLPPRCCCRVPRSCRGCPCCRPRCHHPHCRNTPLLLPCCPHPCRHCCCWPCHHRRRDISLSLPRRLCLVTSPLLSCSELLLLRCARSCLLLSWSPMLLLCSPRWRHHQCHDTPLLPLHCPRFNFLRKLSLPPLHCPHSC